MSWENLLDGSAFVRVNTSINGTAGLKSTLESTLSTSADFNTMLSGYSAFSSGIESLVDTSFVGAGDVVVQAYTRMLVLINIAS